jgi:chemotaxis protein MotA
MFAAVGIVVVLLMVFGGFILAGGKMDVILYALPLEMLIIGGAALGATITGNSLAETEVAGRQPRQGVGGPRYGKQDFLDTIFLVSKLMKMLRTEGPVAVEPHIEEPATSDILPNIPACSRTRCLCT